MTSNNKILVVGASGLLGRNFINYLNKQKFKFDITYRNNKPPHKNGKCIKCDLLDINQVKNKFTDYDVIYMCAGVVKSSKSSIEPEIFFQKNLLIFFNLFYSSIDNNIKQIIWVSSSTIYKNKKNKIKENDKKMNFDYNISGIFIFLEKISALINHLKKVKITFIRTGNIYGPHDHFGKKERSQVLPNLVEKVIINKIDKSLLNSQVIRDFTYAEDLVRAMIMISKIKKNLSPINFSYGKPLSIQELTKILCKKLNKKFISGKYVQNKTDSKVLDNKKFDFFFKQFKRTSFDAGINQTIKWYKNEKK